LDKVQPLVAACMSAANIQTVKQLTLQVVETQRALQALKLGEKPTTPTSAPAPSGAPAVSPSSEPKKGGDEAQPYTALPSLQTDVPQNAVIAQLLQVPEAVSSNGTDVYGVQINVSQGVPPANDEVIKQTQWLMDVTYLATWWSSITPEQRRMPENIQRGRELTTRMFQDTSMITKSKRMALLTEAALSKDQLASLAQCLSTFASQ